MKSIIEIQSNIKTYLDLSNVDFSRFSNSIVFHHASGLSNILPSDDQYIWVGI